MRQAMVVSIAVLGLTGCAQVVWEKPGLTQQEFAADSSACRMQAAQSSCLYCPGNDPWRAVAFENFSEQCMIGKGYHKTESRPASQQAAEPQPSFPAPKPPTSEALRETYKLRPCKFEYAGTTMMSRDNCAKNGGVPQ